MAKTSSIALGVVLLSAMNMVNGQVTFEGCSSFENARANLLLRSTVTCLGTTAGETLQFLNSIPEQDMAKVQNCFANPTTAMADCQYVTQWLGSEATQEGKVPYAIIDTILTDPVNVCGCLAPLPDSTNARSLDPNTCDAYRIVEGLQSLNTVCAQATMAEEWLQSEWVEGCDSADLVKLSMSAMPMKTCLGLEPTDLKKLEANVDKEVLAEVKSCVYNPIEGNTDCDELLNNIEANGAQEDSVMSRVLESIIEDPDEFCECTMGLGYNEFALSVRDECKMKELIKYAQGADDVCAMVKANEDKIQKELEGCDEVDMVRAQLTGINMLNCLEIDPKEGDAIMATITGVDIDTLSDISRCYQTETTTSKACQKQLKQLAREAASSGDVLTARLATELIEDPSRICSCVQSSTTSSIWTDMSSTCKPNALNEMISTIDETCMQIENKVEPEKANTAVFSTGIAYNTQLEQELKEIEEEKLAIEFMYAREIEYDTCIGFVVAKCSEADDMGDCVQRMKSEGEIDHKCLLFLDTMMDPEAQDCAATTDAACPPDAFSEYGSKASSTHYKCITDTLKENDNRACMKTLRPVRKDVNCYMEIMEKCGKFENMEDHTWCIEKNMLKFSCDCAEIFIGKRDQCASVKSAGRGGSKNRNRGN